jgi:hypothetical protein
LAHVKKQTPLIGVAQDVVALGSVLREIERRGLEDSDEVGEPFHQFLAAAKLRGIVDDWHVRRLVGLGQRANDLFVDQVADSGLPLSATISALNRAPLGIVIVAYGMPAYLSLTYVMNSRTST